MLMPIMGYMRRSRLLIPLLLITTLGLIPVGASAQTDDIEEAKEVKENAYEQWQAARAEMDAAVDVLVELEAQLGDLEYRIDRMEGRIDEDQENIADLRTAAQNLVVNAYVNSGSSTLESALDAANIQDILTAQHIINRAADKGTATLDRLDATTRDMQRQSAILDEDRAEIAELRAEQATQVANLDAMAAEAEELYRSGQGRIRRRGSRLGRGRARPQDRRSRSEERRRRWSSRRHPPRFRLPGCGQRPLPQRLG